MKVVSIANILNKNVKINNNVLINGWVRTRRDSKSGISFLSVYDGSCFSSIQVIINNKLPNYKNYIKLLTTGSSVSIIGKVISSPGVKQCIEINAENIVYIGTINNKDTYPISAKYHSMEYLRNMAHLRPRTNIIGAITRIRHSLFWAIHSFMNEQGFFLVSTPLITTLDTEGVSKMFKISSLDIENTKENFKNYFFGKETFLTVSGQLNGEAYACALSKIYTFGPIFRAEKSDTNRHLAEFWMVEPEIAFANLMDIINLSELMLKYIINVVLIERNDDLKFLSDRVSKGIISRLENFVNNNMIKIEYKEAIKILKNSGEKFKYPIDNWGVDLSSEHERYLTEKYFKSPIIIINYPKRIKAFYMRINNDNKTVASMDIIAPGIGEIIGGSQREERLEFLDFRMDELKLNKEKYWWYRDLRRYGTVPHSGFGLGIERLMVFVTGIQNIRDVIPFPRSLNNANF